jgi:hypothetical protein
MTRDLARGTNLPEIVACDAAHGGEVIDVWELPEATSDNYPVQNGRLIGIDSTTQRCISEDGASGAYVEFAGDNRLDTTETESAAGVTEAWRVSGVTPAVFVPGPAGWGRGERWVACAAVLENATAPAQTTETMRGAFSRPGTIDATFSWCKLQPDPEAPDSFDVVACDQQHSHEQLASFRVAATSDGYPGEDNVSQQAETVCPILVAQTTGGRSEELADEFALSWTYPVAGDWAQGDQIARCFMTSTAGPTTGSVAGGTARPAS